MTVAVLKGTDTGVSAGMMPLYCLVQLSSCNSGSFHVLETVQGDREIFIQTHVWMFHSDFVCVCEKDFLMFWFKM